MTLGGFGFGIITGVIVIMLFVIIVAVIISKYEKRLESELNDIQFFYLGKLDDSSSSDDISDAIKYLKLTNSIK